MYELTMSGMKYYKQYEVFCEDCKLYFISDDRPHKMDYCPKCKKNAVDIEKSYYRLIGNITIIKEVD